MAYTITPPTPQQVKAELDADPLGYGYAALEAAQDWNGIVGELNLVRAGTTVERRFVFIHEMVEAMVYSELIAVAEAARDALTLLFIAAGNIALDPKNPNVRGFLTGAFAAGTQTRANLSALAERDGSRAEELWGDGVLVTDSVVEAAARL